MKYTSEQVIQALKATGGFISHAADLLGCDRHTVSKYIKNDPNISVQLHSIKEAHLDLAESGLIQALKQEEEWAIKFYLDRIGRKRGYYRHTKVELIDNVSEKMEAAERRLAGLREDAES